eukprot:TRINITY_DN1044_c0_g2_i6.p1 TRINITY_DN1044_c0_g2~~TRINITY_DN1044_c0_g2_i6.p1  ORF type:complete len:101 (+),score=24.34 TRINITY_DN1044_c0_g2_i6:10-312(+)
MRFETVLSLLLVALVAGLTILLADVPIGPGFTSTKPLTTILGDDRYDWKEVVATSVSGFISFFSLIFFSFSVFFSLVVSEHQNRMNGKWFEQEVVTFRVE